MDDRSKLTKDAQRLLERMGLGNEQPATTELGERRLSPEDETLILRLSSQDLSQAQIAAMIPCDPSTVSRVLASFVSTRDEAEKFIQAKALPAARRVSELMQSKQDKVALDASKAFLAGNKLLGNEDGPDVHVGVQVVLGVPAGLQPPVDPDAPIVTVTSVPPASVPPAK